MRVYQAIAQALRAAENCRESGNAEWLDRWEQRLALIERDILPSGSGFDSGCTINSDSNSKRLRIHTAFHHMNDGGFYDGWTHHDVIVTPDLAHEFDMRITGRNRSGIKEYIADCMAQALQQAHEWPV